MNDRARQTLFDLFTRYRGLILVVIGLPVGYSGPPPDLLSFGSEEGDDDDALEDTDLDECPV